MSTIKEEITSLLKEALLKGEEKGILPQVNLLRIPLEVPRHKGHGDLSSSIAFLLAKETGLPAIEIANTLIGLIPINKDLLEVVELGGQGFINFYIAKPRLYRFLYEFEDELPDIGKGKRILIEFVSSNPTGPLHIGHGRAAVLGDVLANLLEATGFKVEREYYINDVGSQLKTFGRSLKARYLQSLGKDVSFPQDGYKGEYLIEIARDISEKRPDLADYSEEYFARYGLRYILEETKTTLFNFGVRFDRWIREEELYKSGELNKAIEALKEKNLCYYHEGALWFKASLFGDTKDRVLIRENGEPTYFAGDLAYHLNKYSRGYEGLINIWGHDHHGYAPRLKAALSAFDWEEGYLKIILYQMVNLLRDGRPVAMSTRQGEFVTLAEVLKEVGKDACRFYFLMQNHNTHLDFDLELAKKRSLENPVYYVQYAHARISSIFEKAKKKGIGMVLPKDVDLSLLNLKDELALIAKLEGLRDEVVLCVKNYELQRLVTYLIELASLFHNYYNHHRIISLDLSKTTARLILVGAIKATIKRVCGLLGVSTPEKM